MRKLVSMLMACVVLFGNVCVVTVSADEISMTYDSNGSSGTWETGSFNMNVSPYGRSAADRIFPLDAGETARICANFSPTNASVYIGLIDPNGIFHYVHVTNGSVDVTIGIEQMGNYRLAVVNNSGYTITISGFVKY